MNRGKNIILKKGTMPLFAPCEQIFLNENGHLCFAKKRRHVFMNVLLSVSFALLAGLLMTRAFKPFKLPAVTAYLIAGVLIGPYCLGGLHIANGVG